MRKICVKEMNSDTIAAIATAPGEGGISIVRISGPDATVIADRVFTGTSTPPSKKPGRLLAHGTIRSGGMIVDEVILLLMRSPHSYTREDIVEIQTHGGAVSARRVLRCVLENGAIPAEPGEFTRRAFLNGRIDLLQAEAVLDLIRARSERAAQSAVEQLSGRLSAAFEGIYRELIIIASDLEAYLDFSEDDIAPDIIPRSLELLHAVESRMNTLLSTWEEGHVLREGALVVISGRPNVGKSTLLNTLLGMDRAIVSAVPGTTRDTIEEMMILEGLPMRLVDTAGLREPESEVEAHGIARATRHAASADMRIHVIDCSEPLQPGERSEIQNMNPQKTIIALNKADLGVVTQHFDCKELTAILISCLTGSGIHDLKSALLEKMGIAGNTPAHATISEAHRRVLASCVSTVAEATKLLRDGEEAVAISSSRLRHAAEQIGHILGKTYAEDMLDTIFSRFCIGK